VNPETPSEGREPRSEGNKPRSERNEPRSEQNQPHSEQNQPHSDDRPPGVDAQISPRGALELLSQREVEILRARSEPDLLETFRRCALAVLNTGSESDDAIALFETYRAFEIEIVQRTRGLKLRMRNAPPSAFVDNRMIEGVREHLFALLRDLVYIRTEIESSDRFDLRTSQGVTDAVFHILKRACSFRIRSRSWSCAGVATRSRASSTSTRRRSATTWGFVASTSVRVADPAR
jgi:hypothetical protein